MVKQVIFQDSFSVFGIMCHQGCGLTIQNALKQGVEECIQKGSLPKDAKLSMDAEPQAFGFQRFSLFIESNEQTLVLDEKTNTSISTRLQDSINDIGFEVIKNHPNTHQEPSKNINWINILINLLVIAVIMGISVTFSASLPLTIGLTVLSFSTTAFTARHYLIDFVHKLRNKNLTSMTTTVTLGWVLSLTHTLYHAIAMPLAIGFPMIFMSFIMPVLLIAMINGMDEIKRLILNQSRKMYLNGLKTLFPQMADEYLCYSITQEEQNELIQLVTTSDTRMSSEYLTPLQQTILSRNTLSSERKSLLKKGMIIQVNRGECFPVDGFIIQGHTLVDDSLLTGEHQRGKKRLDFVPAGAVNLGQTVIMCVSQEPYNSTINQLIFPANREKNNQASPSDQHFTYLYMTLIGVGIAASIGIPFAMGILSFPLLLQNITGILFAVCPCTIAIAGQLPNLLSIYQRNQNGILLRNENLNQQFDDIHTVVIDKTGTLTTGNSQVVAFSKQQINPSMWERIYLLEEAAGAEHPIAKAIKGYYQQHFAEPIIKQIEDISRDSENRGLSANVQGKVLHIGNEDYLRQNVIGIEISPHKIPNGYTPVYVAENHTYQGVIFIKHEVRKGILPALSRLKNAGIHIIMLTGDKQSAAEGFNQQNGSIFNPDNIQAGHTPEKKDAFLNQLMQSKNKNPKGVWFIGDGLNDTRCARTVTERGGVSCAMTSEDKTTFFTDISLNGSLNYLFEHHKLNRFLQKTIRQNQWLLAYGSLAFLAFIVAFSIVGIAVSPLIPLLIMSSTTGFILFNSCRVQLSTDNALNKNTSWLKQLLASDVSIGLLASSSLFLITGLLISTVAAGELALPAIIFTAGVIAGISSALVLTAGVLLGAFALLATSYLCFDKLIDNAQVERVDSVSDPVVSWSRVSTILPEQENKPVASLGFGFNSPRHPNHYSGTVPNISDRYKSPHSEFNTLTGKEPSTHPSDEPYP